MSDAELNWMRDVHVEQPDRIRDGALRAGTGLNGRGDEAARVLRALCNIHDAQRCEQARVSWKASQQQHPELASVPAP